MTSYQIISNHSLYITFSGWDLCTISLRHNVKIGQQKLQYLHTLFDIFLLVFHVSMYPTIFLDFSDCVSEQFFTLSSLAATGKGILHCLDFARVCFAGEGLPRSHLSREASWQIWPCCARPSHHPAISCDINSFAASL